MIEMTPNETAPIAPSISRPNLPQATLPPPRVKSSTACVGASAWSASCALLQSERASVVMSDAARSNRWKPTFYVLIEDNAAEEWWSLSQYLEVVVTKCR